MTIARLFPLDGGRRVHPDVEHWFAQDDSDLRRLARRWFEVMRGTGSDVLDVLHDGHPTACVGSLAFGYVNVFRAHVNVGFFLGTQLDDPHGLLEGTGRYMRHVKLRTEAHGDSAALRQLISAAYADMKSRLNSA